MKKIISFISLFFSIQLYAVQTSYEFIDCKNIDIRFNGYIKERRLCTIVVPQDISKDSLKDMLIKVVQEKSSENKNVDEITVRAYFQKNNIGISSFIAQIEWAPNGKWGSAKKAICTSNNRTTYKYNFDIKSHVGKKLNNRPTEKENHINAIVMKALYADEDMPEETVLNQVGKQFNMTGAEIRKIVDKVWEFNIKNH